MRNLEVNGKVAIEEIEKKHLYRILAAARLVLTYACETWRCEKISSHKENISLEEDLRTKNKNKMIRLKYRNSDQI